MLHCLRRLCGVALSISVLLAVAAIPARAQTAPTAAPAAPAASADELQGLVDALQDPTARQRLVSELQTLIAAQRGTAPAATGPATLIERASQQIDTITDEILAAAQVAVDAPRLAEWVKTQASDRAARDFWLAVLGRLAVIFGIGLVADRLTYALLRGPMRRLERAPGESAGAQLFLIALGSLLEALPAIAFAVAASLAVPFTNPQFGTSQVARVLIGAILWARIILAVMRNGLLLPSAVRLYPLSEETRQYLYIWARRFTGWTVYGFAVAAGAWWLGVPGAVYALILRGTILVLAILAVVFVLQNRRTVADWLRGDGAADGGWRVIKLRLADTWHVLAIIYVVGSFGVFVLDVQGSFLFLLRATVVTVVVLLAAALVVRAIERLSGRGFAVRPELKARYPTLEARANRYLPVLHYVAALIIYGLAALTILVAWGVNAFAWLDTEVGRRAAGSFVTVAVVLLSALVAWEFFSSTVERYLAATSDNGARVARRARARTLLPLLRTSVMVVVIVLVGLVVLSELGLNIAPLLAGAGVVGLAVGFGSQALVKDVITGLFMLVEDTLAVGDVVDVGKGSGVVESITIRTIRLRDISGTLQTIPFSEVSSVKNMSRDFAFAVHDIGVLYREDPDRVIAVMVEVGAAMAADREWSGRVLGPLEVIGLDRFTDTAQVIRVRLKTAPLHQWAVQHEFNRRVKQAFDRHGIEMPAANQTRYLDPPATA